jgi:RimJ/RimL family protein N-acetyltransferase
MARLLQDGVTLDFVSLGHSPTEAEERTHFEATGQDHNIIDWMIAVRVEGTEELVGVTSLQLGKGWNYSRRLSSGILLANRTWWGQGIASTTHRLRTWYAFNTLGAYGINSSVLEGNDGSARALMGVGYIEVGRELRTWLKNGRWLDATQLNSLNPAAVSQLWPDGNVPDDVQAGLIKTQAALDWARETIPLLQCVEEFSFFTFGTLDEGGEGLVVGREVAGTTFRNVCLPVALLACGERLWGVSALITYKQLG